MKNTELDVIHNLILDMGLTLKKLTEFSAEQKIFNERFEKKLDKLERSQAKTNLMLQQVNLSTMKLAEDSKRIDNVEQRLKKLEMNH